MAAISPSTKIKLPLTREDLDRIVAQAVERNHELVCIYAQNGVAVEDVQGKPIFPTDHTGAMRHDGRGQEPDRIEGWVDRDEWTAALQRVLVGEHAYAVTGERAGFNLRNVVNWFTSFRRAEQQPAAREEKPLALEVEPSAPAQPDRDAIEIVYDAQRDEAALTKWGRAFGPVFIGSGDGRITAKQMAQFFLDSCRRDGVEPEKLTARESMARHRMVEGQAQLAFLGVERAEKDGLANPRDEHALAVFMQAVVRSQLEALINVLRLVHSSPDGVEHAPSTVIDFLFASPGFDIDAAVRASVGAAVATKTPLSVESASRAAVRRLHDATDRATSSEEQDETRQQSEDREAAETAANLRRASDENLRLLSEQQLRDYQQRLSEENTEAETRSRGVRR